MTFSMRRVLKDKQELREQLAAKPIGDKLRILDELRAREIAIRTGSRSPRDVRRDASAGGGPSAEKKR